MTLFCMQLETETVVFSVFTFSSPLPLPKEDLHAWRASKSPQVSQSLVTAIVAIAIVFRCFLHWESITRLVNG